MKDLEDVLKQESLERLRTAYAENKSGRGIVFFIGSGLSSAAGLPDWKGLAEGLTEECRKIAEINPISEKQLGPLYAKLLREPDLWEKFSLIKEILGRTTFSASVGSRLSTSGLAIPESFNLLCKLNVAGFISLNIDDFLIRSMRAALPDPVYPVYGKGSLDRLQELTRHQPFLYQPHGSITSESSWVFTKKDFVEICDSPLHDEFLSSIFLRDTVVFVGISANDVGASLRLANLNKKGLRPGSHYWITTTSYVENRIWAEENGVQQILYPSNLGHDACISEIVKSISIYQSIDEVVNRPVIGSAETLKGSAHLSPKELFKLDDIDQIRVSLNSIIQSATNGGEISYDSYSKICKDYARAIHSCYMMPSGNEGEKWFGYHITGTALGGKTIGRVIPAIDTSGEPVVIKILDQRRYSDELYLSAFRRGIKALKILGTNGVDGTVNVRDAYELPPTIVMDYLNCASLEDSVLSGKLSGLNSLKVLRSASGTILQAHLLAEIVLHRDIRPSNILLEGFDWLDGSFESVKVIDFDLAWHRGALGEDFVRSDRDALGFQAPEQLQGGDAELRRTTSIDSFGLGASLYFAIAKKNPDLSYFNDDGWKKATLDYASRRLIGNPEIAKFIAELIADAMQRDPKSRISVAEIHSRLGDVIEWIEGSKEACSRDFLAEMLCSMSSPSTYEIDRRRKTFSFHTSSGLTVDILHDFLDGEYEVHFKYQKPGNIDNSRADKTLNTLKSDFDGVFRPASPRQVKFNFTGGTREFEARVTSEYKSLISNFDALVNCIEVVVRRLNIQ